VVAPNTDVGARLDAGADIINVAGAARTPEIVAKIRQEFPDVPIMATGGNSEESILATIRAGANAVTYTPPTSSQLFTNIMQGYRQKHAEKE
jgi:2-keto-3-deoxy-6-phosphogluconate aldolase